LVFQSRRDEGEEIFTAGVKIFCFREDG